MTMLTRSQQQNNTQDYYSRAAAKIFLCIIVGGVLISMFYWASCADQFSLHGDNIDSTTSFVTKVVDHRYFVENHRAAIKKIPVIRQVSVLGERNSGTRWTFDHLDSCFGHELQVTKNLTRYKHWFQFNDSTRYPHDTLVIAQFRNPYDWLKAMERVPHHAPNHLRTKDGANSSSNEAENDWKVFLTKEWTMDRVGGDLNILAVNGTTGSNVNEIICQDHFLYRDIVSCVPQPLPLDYYHHKLRFSENEPFYEMRNDASGQPYANIMELRADKIRNFLSVKDYSGVADVWPVQYEYLLHHGTHSLLQRIQEWTGVEAKCRGIPPQQRDPKPTRVVTQEFARHVRLHLNWTVESMVGYEIEWTRENNPIAKIPDNAMKNK